MTPPPARIENPFYGRGVALSKPPEGGRGRGKRRQKPSACPSRARQRLAHRNCRAIHAGPPQDGSWSNCGGATCFYPFFKGSSPNFGDGIDSKPGRPGVYPLVKGGRLGRQAERGDFDQPDWFHCLSSTLHEPCARVLHCRWEALDDTQGSHPTTTGERRRQREKIPPLVRCAHESAPFDKGGKPRRRLVSPEIGEEPCQKVAAWRGGRGAATAHTANIAGGCLIPGPARIARFVRMLKAGGRPGRGAAAASFHQGLHVA